MKQLDTYCLIHKGSSFSASIVSGYRAWKAILRSSHKIAIKGTDETYYQSIYVRSGGFLRALEDFYSLKPSYVQYFQRNNMVCVFKMFGGWDKYNSHHCFKKCSGDSFRKVSLWVNVNWKITNCPCLKNKCSSHICKKGTFLIDETELIAFVFVRRKIQESRVMD